MRFFLPMMGNLLGVKKQKVFASIPRSKKKEKIPSNIYKRNWYIQMLETNFSELQLVKIKNNVALYNKYLKNSWFY